MSLAHTLKALLTADSTQQHEQCPHGVPPSYSWFYGPITQAGITPGTNTRMNPWGQLYTAIDGNPQPSAAVEIRELQLWTLDSANVWTALYPSPPTLVGSEYPENFQGSASAAPVYPAPQDGSIIGQPVAGHLFHFYPGGARAVIPADLKGIVVSVRARLVGGYYAIDSACPGLILNVGADYWPDASSGSVSGIGQGRFKTVKPTWRTFTYTTLSAAQVQTLAGTDKLPPLTVDLGELF